MRKIALFKDSLAFLLLMSALCFGCNKDDNLFLVNDLDGNSYKTVKIGNQLWFAENLKVTKLNDGTLIPNVTDSLAWRNSINPAYCWYNNDEAQFKVTYGGLYNWYSVNTNKLCPSGWHVPTKAEWDTLKSFLGGYNDAGNKMKEIGTSHWTQTDSEVTNESGFTGLPGGIIMSKGTCRSIGTDAYFWSSTEYDLNYAWVFRLVTFSGTLSSFYPLKSGGTSIRCIKD